MVLREIDFSGKVILWSAFLNRETSTLRRQWVVSLFGLMITAFVIPVTVALSVLEKPRDSTIAEAVQVFVAAVTPTYFAVAVSVVLGILLLDTLFSLTVLAKKELGALRVVALGEVGKLEKTIKRLEEEGEAKDVIIANQTERERVDRTTTIPNEVALHYEKGEKIVPGKVLIVVDIVGFGEFNNAFGRTTANTFLRDFARFLFLGARRLENVYRLNESMVQLEVPKGGGAYRLHRAGDEFVIVLQGSEADALGFLSRIRSFCTQYSKTKFEGGSYPLMFYAGVAEIGSHGTPDEYLVYADECLREARVHPEVGRVRWHSGKNSNELVQREGEPDEVFHRRQSIYRGFETDEYWQGTPALNATGGAGAAND